VAVEAKRLCCVLQGERVLPDRCQDNLRVIPQHLLGVPQRLAVERHGLQDNGPVATQLLRNMLQRLRVLLQRGGDDTAIAPEGTGELQSITGLLDGGHDDISIRGELLGNTLQREALA